MTEVGNGVNEGERYQGMVFHAGLDCLEDSEVLAVHCPHYGWIELHGCGVWLFELGLRLLVLAWWWWYRIAYFYACTHQKMKVDEK